MTSRRCPTCRTFCNSERDARCFACGEPICPTTVNRPSVDQGVERESTQDVSASRIVFAVMGALGGLAFCLNERGGGGILLLAAFGILVIAGIVGFVSGRRAAAQAVLLTLSGIGVVLLILGLIAVGILIFLLILCSSGGMRLGG